MAAERSSPVGQWRIITSNSRFLPVNARLIIDERGGLEVDWEECGTTTKFQLFPTAELAGEKLTRRFTVGNNEVRHLLSARVETDGAAVAGGERQHLLFGFLRSEDDRENSATGLWLAEVDEPIDPPERG